VERADALAFGTYIESEGGRLLDLSMYLSDENFDVLRGAFAKLLPVPARYYVPGVLRREARRRCDGLIPASSVSATDPAAPLPLPSAMTATALPATREKILAKAVAERIKQVAIAANFLQAIQSRLGEGKYFFGDKPSSLDCLAVGYLSLGLYAELPNGWLREEMLHTRHGRLCTYVSEVRGEMLGDGIDVVAVMSGQATVTTSSGQVVGGGLPWGIVEPQYVPRVTRFLLNRAMEMVGITSTEGHGSGRGEKEQTQEKEEHEKGMKSLQRWGTAKNMAVVVGCIGAFIGYCVWNGLITMELGGRGKDEVAGGVTGGSGGREDDEEKDVENEMELLEGFGSAEAILGLGVRESFTPKRDEVDEAFVRGVNEEEEGGVRVEK